MEPDVAIVSLLSRVTGLRASQSTENPFDGNLWRGPMREPEEGCPVKAVSVLSTGGLSHDRFLGTSTDLRVSTVQVRIRSENHDFSGGQELARACSDAIDCHDVAGYIDIRVREPEPNYLQRDDVNRHHWSFNVELWRTVAD